MPNKALQPTATPPLRSGAAATELGRYASNIVDYHEVALLVAGMIGPIILACGVFVAETAGTPTGRRPFTSLRA